MLDSSFPMSSKLNLFPSSSSYILSLYGNHDAMSWIAMRKLCPRVSVQLMLELRSFRFQIKLI